VSDTEGRSSERERCLLWDDVPVTPDGKGLHSLGEVLDALGAAWRERDEARRRFDLLSAWAKDVLPCLEIDSELWVDAAVGWQLVTPISTDGGES
jgi:hypothetical protein